MCTDLSLLLEFGADRQDCESLYSPAELYLLLRVIVGQEPVHDLSRKPLQGPLIELCGVHARGRMGQDTWPRRRARDNSIFQQAQFKGLRIIFGSPHFLTPTSIHLPTMYALSSDYNQPPTTSHLPLLTP